MHGDNRFVLHVRFLFSNIYNSLLTKDLDTPFTDTPGTTSYQDYFILVPQTCHAKNDMTNSLWKPTLPYYKFTLFSENTYMLDMVIKSLYFYRQKGIKTAFNTYNYIFTDYYRVA